MMTKIVYELALVLTLGVTAVGCTSTKEAQPSGKRVTQNAPASAIQETEPLEFRIDGMRRVNGAL